jgi:hypothetical protein
MVVALTPATAKRLQIASTIRTLYIDSQSAQSQI